MKRYIFKNCLYVQSCFFLNYVRNHIVNETYNPTRQDQCKRRHGYSKSQICRFNRVKFFSQTPQTIRELGEILFDFISLYPL